MTGSRIAIRDTTNIKRRRHDARAQKGFGVRTGRRLGPLRLMTSDTILRSTAQNGKQSEFSRIQIIQQLRSIQAEAQYHARSATTISWPR